MLSNCFRLFPQFDCKLPEEQILDGNNCVLIHLVIIPTYNRIQKKFIPKDLHPQSLPFLCPQVSVFGPFGPQ